MRYPFWLNDNVDIDISWPNIHTSTFTLHKIYSLNTLFVSWGVKYNCVSYVHLDIRFVFCFCIIIGYKVLCLGQIQLCGFGIISYLLDIRSCVLGGSITTLRIWSCIIFLYWVLGLVLVFASPRRLSIKDMNMIVFVILDISICVYFLTHAPLTHWILGLVHIFLIPYPSPLFFHITSQACHSSCPSIGSQVL